MNTSSHISVLAIDDDRKTIDGLISELRLYYQIDVELAETVGRAEELLQGNEYSMLIVDMRFAEDDQVVEDGGLKLILKLRKGSLGGKNSKAPYLLLTAQDFHIAKIESRLSKKQISQFHDGRIGLIGKGHSIRETADRIGAFLGRPRRGIGDSKGIYSSRPR